MKTESPVSRGVSLLIVEDDVLPAMALRDELEDAGYSVMDLTERASEALAAARECKPDMALVNIELQGRDDGIALAQKLTDMGIPVLFISGQVSRARSASTAAVGSLPKPYPPADVLKAVNYLFLHLKGDESLARPYNLEVFDTAPGRA